MKLSELLTDESKWTKGDLARKVDGSKADVKDPQAVKWCLLGAICKCEISSEDFSRVIGYINNSFAVFNDTATWPDIQKLMSDLNL